MKHLELLKCYMINQFIISIINLFFFHANKEKEPEKYNCLITDKVYKQDGKFEL